MQKSKSAVVFVHGLAKKPPPPKLEEIWLWGLSRDNPMPTVFKAPNKGIKLSNAGVPALFSYYADVFYGEDYEAEFDSYYEAEGTGEMEADSLHEVERELLLPRPMTPREKRFMRQVELKLKNNPAMLASDVAPPAGGPAKVIFEGKNYEIASWLPDKFKQGIIKKAAMEAYYYLFNKEYMRPDGKRFMVRQELRERLLEKIKEATVKSDKVVLVTHSMGTMIGYDVLRNCPECDPVDTFITVGSPLGITEVQEELIAEGVKEVDFPAEKVKNWINIYDPLDPVCGADPRFANDYKSVNGRGIIDIEESNWGSWRHTITHYFAGTLFRKQLLLAIS